MSDKCKNDGDKGQSKDIQNTTCKSMDKKDETSISGGDKCGKKKDTAPKCPPTPCRNEPPPSDKANFWKKVSLMGAFPLVAILAVLVFTSHKEDERPEYKFWPHMYKRSKPFFFGDGNRTAFYNAHWNALPPEGYEDEIDMDAGGKPVETDKERDQRLKDFGAVHKEWKKVASKREAEVKKAEAAAEKEAKKLQAEAEKEEKRQRAEEDKERKRQEAEEAKERKRQEAEEKKLRALEEKERKRLEAAEEKERKRLEAAEQKRLKEEEAKAQKVDFVFEIEPENVPAE